MRLFHEIDIASLKDAIVIIDVDGTITNDKSHTIEPARIATLRTIAGVSNVYLCSNDRDKDRIKDLAELTGTKALNSLYRKPSRRVIEGIETRGKRLVVIGDKRLTDGRFAKRIGAEFIHVKRVRHASDRPSTLFFYDLDDLYHSIVRALERLKSRR